MGKKITRAEAEALLEKRFLMKYVKFEIPGYDAIYGRVDQVAIDTSSGSPEVVFQINDKRYSCSPEALKDCIELLNKN